LLLMRRGEATLAEATRERGGDAESVRAALDGLVEDGFAERVGATGDPRYRIRLAARRGRQMPADVWSALGQPEQPPTRADAGAPGALRVAAWRLMVSDLGRVVLSSSPIVLIALIGEALLLSGSASYAGVFGFSGIIANSMTAGIFPVLLLV